MTAADPLISPDALALLAAIDAGDDSLLPILADLLEDAGDARAAGLRAVPADFRPADYEGDGGAYVGLRTRHDRGPETLPPIPYGSLRGGEQRGRGLRRYPRRSAAFLALALALGQ